MKIIYLVICILLFSGKLYAQDLELEIQGTIDFSGSWVLPTEAGEDYSQTLTETQEIFLSISDPDYFGKKSNVKKWRVFVSINSELTGSAGIEAKRTGKGNKVGSNGNPNIHDGDFFRSVTSTETYFFRGMGEISIIPVSFKLTGMSVLVGEESAAQTEIIFTIKEGWK